jgi:hypothetical protein
MESRSLGLFNKDFFNGFICLFVLLVAGFKVEFCIYLEA